MKEEEKQLIRDAQRGDVKAFEKLLKIYEQKIYNLICGMVHERSTAEDIFQETFLKAWRKINTFEGKSEFSTWLYRIALNEILMRKRKEKVQTLSLDDPLSNIDAEIQNNTINDWSQNPLATIKNKALKEELQKAISGLPEKYKSVLIMRDIDGLSNKEVSEILGITVANVKLRLHRARLFLRNKLSSYFKENL